MNETVNIDTIDNIIMKHQDTKTFKEKLQEWQIKEDYLNDTIYADKHYYNFYKELSWYRDYKKQSQVLGILYKYSHLFNQLGVTLDKVIITLCSLINYSNNKLMEQLPDRYLVIRNQTSRNTTNQIIYILSLCGLLNMEIRCNNVFYKLNKDILNMDPYIKVKSKSLFKSDAKVIIRCVDENYLFYYPYAKKTILKNLKQLIFGITLAYNRLGYEYLNTERRKTDINLYGERLDIEYMEVPVHIISRVTNIKPSIIMNYIRRLCKSSNYISQHKLAYVPTNNVDNYYNRDYKWCDMIKGINVDLPYGHCPLTPYSVIIFRDNFENNKIGKNSYKRLEEYKQLVIRELFFINIDKQLGKYTIPEFEYVNDQLLKDSKEEEWVKLEKFTNSQYKENNFKAVKELFDPSNKQAHLVRRDKLQKTNVESKRKDRNQI